MLRPRTFADLTPPSTAGLTAAEHIAAVTAEAIQYHQQNGNLMPGTLSGEPLWRDPDANTEERLQRLFAADPECVDWSTRKLGGTIDRCHTAVQNSEWHKQVMRNREERIRMVSEAEYFG